MATVDIHQLCKSYGDTRVLTDVNLHVEDGEFLTLLGPSGCGKTTTLRCLAGLERADSGTITIGQNVVASAKGPFVPPNRRDIGMVFQSYALWPHMSVFANVAYPLRMRRVSRAERNERVMQILTTVGMGQLARRQVTELSGGQQQRVALARAMVGGPGLLLFDEPLSNLDAKLRKTMRREIASAHARSGATSIYVTHDQEEAITLSDRIVVLRHGVIQQIGTPREIYRSPANPFVADFVGFDNLLVADVVDQRDGLSAVTVGAPTNVVWSAHNHSPKLGTTTVLAMRAEDLLVTRPEEDYRPGIGAFHGTVVSRGYAGQYTEYVVDVGGQNILAHQRDDGATEHDRTLDVGAAAVVRVDANHCVIMPVAASDPQGDARAGSHNTDRSQTPDAAHVPANLSSSKENIA